MFSFKCHTTDLPDFNQLLPDFFSLVDFFHSIPSLLYVSLNLVISGLGLLGQP